MISKKEIKEKIGYFACVRGNDYDYAPNDYDFGSSINHLVDYIYELAVKEREEAVEEHQDVESNDAWEKSTYD
jgi:hypothetical protein